jgi:lipoprotein-anchoring transpeptidase ErfK/SrfK
MFINVSFKVSSWPQGTLPRQLETLTKITVAESQTGTPMTTRRHFVSWLALGGATLALQGCVTTKAPDEKDAKGNKKREPKMDALKLSATGRGEDYASMYEGYVDGGFKLPGIPYEQIPEAFRRQIVRNSTGYPAGTIVVDTGARHLYLTYPGGKAIRYGVGVGREGFEWSGEAVMQWKREWPKWTPPDEMIARRPDLAKYSAENGGQKPGLDNPLGARAMYIFKDGKDTEFRLHGTPEWKSIGTNASSGCIRLINQDVIDLYARVRGGMKIVVV